MHLLIIPSEEFWTDQDHLAGIFQRHQAAALRAVGIQVGALSVRLKYSIPMLLKGILARSLGLSGSSFLPAGGSGILWRRLIQSLRDSAYGLQADAQDGIPYIRSEQVYLFPPHPSLDAVSWCRAGERAFWAYARLHGRPDLIHCHNCIWAGVLGRKLQASQGIPFLITEHSSYYERGLYPRKVLKMARKALESSRCNLAVSQALAETVRKATGAGAGVVDPLPNVLAPEFEARGATPERTPGEKFTFLMVCTLTHNKRVDLAIAALAQAVAQQPEIRLRVVGSGPERASLEALTRERGVQDRVFFVGQKSSQEVRAEMLAADGLILASDVETFGVVLIEAMACGRPAIATRCGGPESILTRETGILVPTDNVDAMAAAMLEMRKRIKDFQPEIIRSSALKRFGGKAFAESLCRIYREILRER